MLSHELEVHVNIMWFYIIFVICHITLLYYQFGSLYRFGLKKHVLSQLLSIQET